MKVTIKNFQSIEDLSFDLPEKEFTCLVGQSNIGKSAIRRALECVLYNKSEVSYIRNGSKTCSVHIIFDNGKNVKWMRDDKSSWYEVDGESFSKLNKSVPQPLLDLGFRELTVNKDKINVQVASQFDNIFLLNETGGKVTDILSNLGNLNRVINANKSCLTDIKDQKNRLGIRKDDASLVKEKIKGFSGLDEARKDFDIIKEAFLKINKNKSKVVGAKQLSNKIDKKQATLQLLSELPNTPSLQIDSLLLEKLIELNKKISFLEKRGEHFKDISNPPDSPQVNFEIVTKLRDLNRRIILSEKRIATIGELPQTLDINLRVDTCAEVRKIYNKVLDLKDKILKRRDQIKASEVLLDNLEKEKKDIQKELRVCPLCDQEFK